MADMTRDELKAHLKANEAEVKRMTEGATEKISNLEEKFDEKLNTFASKAESIESKNEAYQARVEKVLNSTETWSRAGAIIASIIIPVLIALFVYALNRIDRVEERQFNRVMQMQQDGVQPSQQPVVPPDTGQ